MCFRPARSEGRLRSTDCPGSLLRPSPSSGGTAPTSPSDLTGPSPGHPIVPLPPAATGRGDEHQLSTHRFRMPAANRLVSLRAFPASRTPSDQVGGSYCPSPQHREMWSSMSQKLASPPSNSTPSAFCRCFFPPEAYPANLTRSTTAFAIP